MTDTTYLQFEGLNNPVALDAAAEIEALLSVVLAAWPHRRIAPAPGTDPFATITPTDTGKWSLHVQGAPNSPRQWDAVNIVCDLVAEMAWERLRSDVQLLCLHAAAVEFGGRLVVFPNARRSGKSTLAAALARLGHRLYTDDFLPIRVDQKARAFVGIANGVAPRVRLPLPAEFSAGFHDWVAQDPGPFNSQYKYLMTAALAPGGETLPLGATVVLDRQDDPVEPSLTSVPREDGLAGIITQNFARAIHAGTILRSIDTLSRHLPVFRLSYHCGEAAADFLHTHPALKGLPVADIGDVGSLDRQAPLDQLGLAAPGFERTAKYVQAPGLTETEAGSDRFLADGTGLSIYRLNAGSVAIWRLLADPTDLGEVIEVLTTAFPDAAPERIASDSEHLMRSMAKARLIMPVPMDLAAQ